VTGAARPGSIPEVPVDALSDVLRAVRLTGAIFFDVHASEPWVAQTPVGRSIVGRMFPGAEHLISYHVVMSGTCWAGIAGEPPLQLSAGDIIVFPHGDSHGMSSAPGMRDRPNLSLYRRPTEDQLPFTISVGASGPESARFICGFLGCDARPFNPLLAALPRAIHVNGRAGGALGPFVEFAVAEAKARRPGSECVLGHVSELMFVDVVRAYLETLPPDRTGWLAGLRDRFVGRALTSLHHDPARGWTLDLLAHDVGLSRSVLADRFAQLVGQPPMQYLANWRMQLAANQLVASTDSIADVADRVGYESEAAFSRAFKKATGVAPSQWRIARRGSSSKTAAKTKVQEGHA
jgi:AraC-like DNA-binding protein